MKITNTTKKNKKYDWQKFLRLIFLLVKEKMINNISPIIGSANTNCNPTYPQDEIGL